MWELYDQAMTFGLDPAAMVGMPAWSLGAYQFRKAIWTQGKWASHRLKAQHKKRIPKPPRDEGHYEWVHTYTFREAIGLERRKAPEELADPRSLIYDEAEWESAAAEDADPAGIRPATPAPGSAADVLPDDVDPLAGYFAEDDPAAMGDDEGLSAEPRAPGWEG